ncbi:hypothetical protein SOVF_063350 [Spinacia oleracea]|nr:hypothetical protein SOVF_063350 [Spinacia oleracea]
MVIFAISKHAHFSRPSQFLNFFETHHFLEVLANGFVPNWSSKSGRRSYNTRTRNSWYNVNVVLYEDDFFVTATDVVPLREVLPPGGRVGEGSRSPTPDDIRLEFGEPLKSSFVPEENPVGSSGATRNVDLDFVEDATEEANFEWGDEDENWGPISHEPYDMWIKLHGGQAHLVVEYLYSIRPQTANVKEKTNWGKLGIEKDHQTVVRTIPLDPGKH